VIGYGSIGNRHARILQELGCNVSVVSSRKIDFSSSFKTLDEAFRKSAPNYVVIANRTSEHHATLRELQRVNFRGIVMIEKPLFVKTERLDIRRFKKVFVGYNLRFHPVIMRLRDLLKEQSIVLAHAYVGKNLAVWRPQANYRKSYSAFQDQGGGVLRDLSHELDYMNWLLGGWKKLAAVGGHYSKLDIETDDLFSIMMRMNRCENVYVHMNYVDPLGRREMLFVTETMSVKADLLNGWIDINAKRENYPADRDLTYREEHKAVLSGRWKNLCSYQEGLEVMKLIGAAEKASKKSVWIKR
jgi:predicted dehydrogenase